MSALHIAPYLGLKSYSTDMERRPVVKPQDGHGTIPM